MFLCDSISLILPITIVDRISLMFCFTSMLFHRFRPQAAKEVVQNVLSEHLSGKVYASEDVDHLTKKIAAEVRNQVKGD